MSPSDTAVIVLAAGQGTRMKSARPKVLHEVAGWPMIRHVLAAAAAVEPRQTVVVTGRETSAVDAAVAPARTVVQEPPLGTGHAVLQARDALAGFDGTVLILYGDTPLIRRATLERLIAARDSEAPPDIVVLGFRPHDPAEYGRLIMGADGQIDAIVEHRDATAAEREIDLCNSGVMAVDGRRLFELLADVGNDNAKGEYYLTDIIALAQLRGLKTVVVETPEEDVLGVNSRRELAAAEALMQGRLRRQAMAEGVTMTAPETVFLAADTALAPDVAIEPNVVFGPGVTVGEGATIHAFCHIAGAEIAAGASVGPFARLRPGTEIGTGAKVGNFVEVKNAVLTEGAKANHLSYVGDAWIGPAANIGAGTITCNYDGFNKHLTIVGSGAFIGSNSTLVPPVSIEDGAITAAGSVVTKSVEADALAIGRAEQTNRPGAAKRLRERKAQEKAEGKWPAPDPHAVNRKRCKD